MSVIIRNTPLEKIGFFLSEKRRTYSSEEIRERYMDPKFLFYINREGKKRVEIMREGGMQGQYLGACLDYVRVGAMNACFWEFGGEKGLSSFIKEWMEMNKENLIWSDEPIPATLSLPHIDYKNCPKDERHNEKHKAIVDLGGRVRCAHVSSGEMKPNYIHKFEHFDKCSMLPRIDMHESKPDEPYIEDDDYDENGILNEYDRKRLEEYEREMREFEAEEPVIVRDPCYAIISEPKNMILPLEKILSRLNIAGRTNRYVGFPFCGWTLAWYVQKWHDQVPNGQAPLFMRENEVDCYRKWPDFRVISSDD